MPEGIPLQAEIDVDPAAGRVTIDLRDNPDCTPTGLNLSECTAINSGISGVLTVLNSKRDATASLVPNNAGVFRRITVLIRENCVVGIPRHPASCSMATNTVADRALGMIYSAFGRLADGIGLAEPAGGRARLKRSSPASTASAGSPTFCNSSAAPPAARRARKPTVG